MAFYTITRRVLGSIITSIRPQLNTSTSRNIKMFRGIKGIKCNAFTPTRRQPLIRFRKGNYRTICQSCFHLDRLCFKRQSIPDYGTHQFVDEFVESRFNDSRYYINPIVRYPGFSGIAKIPVGHFAGNWRMYAQAKEPGSPAQSTGGPMKSSGGRAGRMNTVHESGFCRKMNRSKLNQIKQLLKDKSTLRGTLPRKEP